MPIRVSGVRRATPAQPAEPDPPPSGQVPGWLRTTANTGIARQGLTVADMTLYAGLPQYGGEAPNITGVHTRRRFNLGGNILAPGDGATFTECYIEGSAGLVQFAGHDVSFVDCDFHITGSGGTERVAINAHPFYNGGESQTGLLVSGCLITGGTVMVNFTEVSGVVEDCYGYGQDPDLNGGVQHRDGFTSRGGSGPIVVQRSRFTCDEGATTGAFFLQDTYGGGNSNITAHQNMFEGSGYCMTIEGSTALTVTDNRTNPFGPYSFSDLTESASTFAEWSGNYRWADTPPDYRGVLLSQP